MNAEVGLLKISVELVDCFSGQRHLKGVRDIEIYDCVCLHTR